MNNEYLDDLKEIKEIMHRSSRFISLSGLSGVANGGAALIGVYLAYELIFKNNNLLSYDANILQSDQLVYLIAIAIGTILLAAGSSIYFTYIKNKADEEPAWDLQTRRLIYSLCIPLCTGGLLCFILLMKGFVGLTPAMTLIFYGLALVNSSKFTSGDIHKLGIMEIILGLVCLLFIEYSLILWAIGFGVLSIVYGVIIQMKDK